jgi:hypothetical protein
MFWLRMQQTGEAGKFTARLETPNLCFRACFAMKNGRDHTVPLVRSVMRNDPTSRLRFATDM